MRRIELTLIDLQSAKYSLLNAKSCLEALIKNDEADQTIKDMQLEIIDMINICDKYHKDLKAQKEKQP